MKISDTIIQLRKDNPNWSLRKIAERAGMPNSLASKQKVRYVLRIFGLQVRGVYPVVAIRRTYLYPRTTSWDKDTLIDLYRRQKLTLQEIGDRYGVSRERIRQVMERFNIKRGRNQSYYAVRSRVISPDLSQPRYRHELAPWRKERRY